VGERDVFPEEFRPFFVFPGALGEAFLARHSALLEVDFWKDMQERQARGEIVEVPPYREEVRLDRIGD
jgi:isocitrate dehydrogenase kinase/phosphatase